MDCLFGGPGLSRSRVRGLLIAQHACLSRHGVLAVTHTSWDLSLNVLIPKAVTHVSCNVGWVVPKVTAKGQRGHLRA